MAKKGKRPLEKILSPEQNQADPLGEERQNPEEVKAHLEKLVSVECGKLNRHRDFFMAKGENPFRGVRKEILRFEDSFDKLAGQKA